MGEIFNSSARSRFRRSIWETGAPLVKFSSPASVALQFSGLIFDGQINHFINDGMFVIPVIRVTLCGHFFADIPLHELVSAVGNNVAGFGPVVAVFSMA